MSKDGYIARFEVAPEEPPSVHVVPITQDAEGHPVVARGEVFDRIASRLARLCGEFGSVVEVKDDGLSVSVADTSDP
jgi:hypothetical protein